ncbi:MAG: tRNA (guanosine(46)-N7)-methyltransferase TrmB [Prevotellaceae bacterium]|jgi:tRNA (guanine-N7-)-methyltransferase|nr:tRNA (guanosine(46)-N7)-methyltransferase TrmB [Prevotellaceae bacterium]
MGKNKQARFAENETFSLLFQPPLEELLRGDFRLKGRWGELMFGNAHPIVLELGCGRGEYTVELARRTPERNFIGIDIKGARLWRGAKTATEEHLPNVAFVRTRVEVITSLFAAGEVSEVWLTFPDPQPSHPRRRLCSPLFLDRYAQLAPAPRGVLHLKTDSAALHAYAKAVLAASGLAPLACTADLYAAPHDDLLDIQTTYEQMFRARGCPITYLRMPLPPGKAFTEAPDPRY